MKRLALSLLGGFAIPSLYYAALTALLLWTENVALFLRLSYPVNWPILVLYRLLPFDSFPLRPGDRTFLTLLVIVCNALLYSLPIYLILWRLSLRKRKAQRVDLPPPPRFV